jgi:sugar lactone lactonase YvrE
MSISRLMQRASSGVASGGGNPWNIANMSFGHNTNYTFEPTNDFYNTRSSFFKPDGMKVYVGGWGASLAQYDLTSPYDLSTISSFEFKKSTGITYNQGLWFKPDGTKFYVVDNSSDSIREWTLSTAWELSSVASTVTNSLSVLSTTTSSIGLVFKPDGTEFYLAAAQGGIHTFTMTTAWDISTASFSSTVTSTGLTNLVAFTLNSDGSKLYFVTYSMIVYERSLSTSYDLSTISATDTNTKSIVSDISNVYNIFLTLDGSKLFASGSLPSAIVRYNMTTADNISTATFTLPNQNFLSVNDYETVPTALHLGNDGTELYICGNTGDDVTQYTLSTAYDLTSASYTRAFSVSSQLINPNNLWFKSNGTVMYVLDLEGHVYVYNLSTAWNISTASYSTNYTYSLARTDGFYFKPDGTKVFHADGALGELWGYNLSTAWDLSTISLPSPLYILALIGTQPSAVFFDSSGTRLFAIDPGSDTVDQWSLSTAWDVATGTYIRSVSTSGESVPQALWFKSDGTKMYILGRITDDVREYTLSTAWDISTATFSLDFYIGAQEANSYGLTFNDSGTRMYVVGSSTDRIYQYDLSTAWSVNTATYSSVSFSVSSLDGTPRQFVFGNSGTKMYLAGGNSDTVHEFNLSTAYDISTMTYNQGLFVRTVEPSLTSVFFKSDGTKFYITGLYTAKILPYSLTTAWDVSTATFDGFPTSGYKSFNPGLADYEGLSFKSDGTKLFLLRSHNNNGLGVNYYDQIEEYSLSTAWDITTASASTIRKISKEISYGKNMFWTSDGSKLYILNSELNSQVWLDFIMNYDA